jgi:predicted PurR-regulated permease PerM
MMTENNNQDELIQLLKDQNQTLSEIKEFLVHQDRRSRQAAIIRFLLAAIPYLILVIVMILVYFKIQEYLNTLNQNIDYVKTSFNHLESSVTTLIDSIKEGFNTLITDIQKLNPFSH